jgi:hypothetical protein
MMRFLKRQLTSQRLDGAIMFLVGYTVMDLSAVLYTTEKAIGVIAGIAGLASLVTGIWWLLRTGRS